MLSKPSSDPADSQRYAYRGGSMRGTFRDGDCLFVAKMPFDDLQTGDVVVYREEEKTVSHRIVRRLPRGWLTQGDANRRPDRCVLRAEALLGRAVSVERAGVRRPVVGGVVGLRRARRLHVRARLRRLAFACLAPFYRLLRATGVVRLVWRPRVLRLRLVASIDSAPDGDCIKYLVRGRTVARWFPFEKCWLCRKPYDLVLTPLALPPAAPLLPSLAASRSQPGGNLGACRSLPGGHLEK